MTAFHDQADHMLQTPEVTEWIDDEGGDAEDLKMIVVGGDFALLRRGRNSHAHADDFDDQDWQRLIGFCRLGLGYGDHNWLLRFLQALPLPPC